MDTYCVTIHLDKVKFEGDTKFTWLEDQVKLLVNYAITHSEMTIDLQRDFEQFNVSEIAPGIDYSKAAYIQSENGYFIISVDMMRHANVVYSRWD